jgi:hypothetical protein
MQKPDDHLQHKNRTTMETKPTTNIGGGFCQHDELLPQCQKPELGERWNQYFRGKPNSNNENQNQEKEDNFKLHQQPPGWQLKEEGAKIMPA